MKDGMTNLGCMGIFPPVESRWWFNIVLTRVRGKGYQSNCEFIRLLWGYHRRLGLGSWQFWLEEMYLFHTIPPCRLRKARGNVTMQFKISLSYSNIPSESCVWVPREAETKFPLSVRLHKVLFQFWRLFKENLPIILRFYQLS